MGIVHFLQELILPQHRVKRRLNSYIKNKHFSGWGGYYYTFLRDRYAVKYGVEIGVRATIEGPIVFPHPRNITIGEEVKIGTNCTIFNNVVIGQNNNKYPVIGNNVTIYSGTVIIGNISIGDNVIIGANSLINKDIENDVVVAGNPARIIKRRSEI
ncbi:MAG: serine acetyltransferase [Lachnospiraceae bacterium]|nr:serine acetyltransferase [Lachnospiraceae bacterium]